MIIGSMIVKNEADRYLQASLSRLVAVCDKVFVADDQSTDDSVQIARGLGCTVWVRPDNVPTFAEHEGRFRQAAWNQMGKSLRVREGSWVLSLDADEYFAGTAAQLKQLQRDAGSRTAFALKFLEVWEEDPLQIRIDGFWRENFNRRIRKWTSDPFLDVPMGSGSVPPTTLVTEIHKISVLHYGYVDKDRRQQKYDFYKSLPNHGHNEGHIDSIIAKRPTLEALDMDVDFWKGVR